jgi:peptidyl-prolyl cis-trans isomerase C
MQRRVSMHISLVLSSTLALSAGCQPSDKAKAADTPAAKTGESEATATEKAPPKIAANANEVDPKPENVVASVGGKSIDAKRLADRFELKMNRMKDPSKRNRTQRTRWLRRVTEELVWQSAYLAAAEAEGLTIDAKEIEDYMAMMMKVPENWARYLEKEAENEDSVRQARRAMAAEKLLLEARGLTKAQETDAKTFYDENKEKAFSRAEEMIRASHFLVAEGPREGHERVQPVTREQREATAPEELARWHELAMKQAKYLRAEAMKPGVDFNDFAREFSEGPGRARGGDMGLFPKKQMVPKYADAAWALEVGEISDVVETSKGIYIIKLFERHPPGILPFDAVKDDILKQLEAQRYRDAKAALRAELQTSLSIEWGMAESGGKKGSAAKGEAAAKPVESAKR